MGLEEPNVGIMMIIIVIVVTNFFFVSNGFFIAVGAVFEGMDITMVCCLCWIFRAFHFGTHFCGKMEGKLDIDREREGENHKNEEGARE